MSFSPATPELAVPDVIDAQHYFRDILGFEVAWHNEAGGIGAVHHGECALFLRKTTGEIRGGTFWIFAEDIDAAHDALQRRGADIPEPIADMPWGLRQFTVKDPYGNTFYFHHDL